MVTVPVTVVVMIMATDHAAVIVTRMLVLMAVSIRVRGESKETQSGECSGSPCTH